MSVTTRHEAAGGVNKLSVDSSCGGTSCFYVPGVANTAPRPSLQGPIAPSVHRLPVPVRVVSPPACASAPSSALSRSLLLHPMTLSWRPELAPVWQPTSSCRPFERRTRVWCQAFSHRKVGQENRCARILSQSWSHDQVKVYIITQDKTVIKLVSNYGLKKHQKQSCDQYFKFIYSSCYQSLFFKIFKLCE